MTHQANQQIISTLSYIKSCVLKDLYFEFDRNTAARVAVRLLNLNYNIMRVLFVVNEKN